jgi:hypothetical protein
MGQYLMAADLHISPEDAQPQLTEYNRRTAKTICHNIHLSHVKGTNHEIFIVFSVQLVLLTSSEKHAYMSYLQNP